MILNVRWHHLLTMRRVDPQQLFIRTSALIIFFILSISAPLAADKQYINLTCSGAEAALVCTKFDSGHCIESNLTIDTPHGVHVVPPKAKLYLMLKVPTIADELSCDQSKSRSAFVVRYSPGNCTYDYCQALEFFDLNGHQITHHSGKGIQKFFGGELGQRKIGKPISLRENEQ